MLSISGQCLLLLSLLGVSFASPAQIGRRDSTTTAAPSAPTPPGTIADCGAYRLMSPGENCVTIEVETGLTTAQFRELNPSVNAQCTNIVAGWAYYIARVDGKVVRREASTAPTPTQSPSDTPAASDGYVAPPGPTKPGTTSCCREWHTIHEGDNCLAITSNAGITLDQFRALNTEVNGVCSNLWIGFSYCIDGDPESECKSSTPTNPPVSTPTPTQIGMASGCTRFYEARSGDYCQSIAWKFDLDVATFIEWNPAVGKDCSAVLAGYYYCVGK